jgi:hypothetical protein
MDSTLESILSDMRVLLRLRPFVTSAYGHRFLRFRGSDAYPLWEAPDHV